ncbi:MAG: phage late control D family protein [Desulfobacteraceae bacterium]|nr:phage late control D family protein [Desulfobacteraceae bacterium]
MTDRRNFDTLTPEFRLKINGQELPLAAKSDLVSVKVLEDVGAMSMFNLTLPCWDNAEMKVKWIDDDLFKEGNVVEIEMGYRDNLERLFRGEITGLEPDFPSEAPPMLTVLGYDLRHRLMGRCKTRAFLNMKDSDIASQIAGDYSLSPDVDDTRVTLDYVLQHNQTDFQFLYERAERIGYEMVVSDRNLHFRERQNQGGSAVILDREVELLDFNARLSTVGQVEEVFVKGWNAKDKARVVARSGIGDERRMGGTASGPAGVREAFAGTGMMTVDLPMLSQAEADELARARFGELALRYIEGQGVCIGRSDLRAGHLVEVQGLGRRFSGIYYVTGTEHTFRPNSGYRTTFEVRRNAT